MSSQNDFPNLALPNSTRTPELNPPLRSTLTTPYFNLTSFCGSERAFIPWDARDLNFGICFQKAVVATPIQALLAIVSAYYIGRQSEWVVRRRWQLFVIGLRMWAASCVALLAIIEPVLIFCVGGGDLYWVDVLSNGVQLITWLVHLSYLSSLKTRLTLGTRGPFVASLSWLPTFLLSVNYARTAFYCLEDTTAMPLLALKVWRATAISLLGIQVLYLLTLFPQGRVGVSQYHELHRSQQQQQQQQQQPDETTPLMETSYHDYSGFHEAADPHNLGVAEDQANMLSRLTLHWVNPLMVKGSQGLLRTHDDLHDLPMTLRTDTVAQKMQWTILTSQPLQSTTPQPPPAKISLLRILHRVLGWKFYTLGFLRLAGDGLGFAGPMMLNRLVKFVESKEEDVLWGWLYGGGLCLAALLATFCSVHFNFLLAKVNLRLRASVITAVYRKVLQVNTASLSAFTTGQVVNMMSTDTDRIVNFCQSFHALWSLPLQVGVTLYLLYTQIGEAFLAGVVVMVLLIPVNKWLANRIGALSVSMMAYKDRRVSLMAEVLAMIRMVKLNAWEQTFKERINDERYGEVKALAGRKYLDAACVYFWATTPVIIPIAAFTTYSLLGNDLEAARVFTAVALFNMLVLPLNALPWVINAIVESWVSLKRVERLIQIEDASYLDYYARVSELDDRETSLQVLISDGTFSWRSQAKGDCVLSDVKSDFALSGVNVQILKGQVVGVVGKVGAGKTSLLNALLAEMTRVAGAVAVAGLENGFGLATQTPWIQNSSIKDNILFGSTLDTSRYRAVLYACALEDDLTAFPHRDASLCGECGVALSGGQKARLALARAVYQNKPIYVFDDIISSLDPPVAKHVMRHCVHGVTKGHTVIITSSNPAYLTHVDWVLRLENGRVVQQGPPGEVLRGDLTPEELSGEWWTEAAGRGSAAAKRRPSYLDPFDVITSEGGDAANVAPSIEPEGRGVGALSWGVLATYLRAIGVPLVALIAVSLTLMQASRNLSDLWLTYWVSQETHTNSTGSRLFVLEPPNSWKSSGTSPSPPTHTTPLHEFITLQDPITQDLWSIPNVTKFYLTVYGILAASNSVFTMMRAFLFAYGGVAAARRLHRKLLDAVLYAKISFHDNNPLGRILNRFSSDLYSVDDSLPFQANILLAKVFGLAGTIVITVYGLPWITLMYLPLAFVYYNIQHYYRHTSRELKRVYAVSLSPLYEHFTETLNGLVVIRAMRAGYRFMLRADNLLDISQRAQFDIQVAGQWLNLRLQLIGVAMLASVSTLALLQHHFEDIEPGLVGLVISYALTVTGYLNSVVTSLTETEQEMVSVERVRAYLDGAEPGEQRDGTLQAPYGWITHGYIRFDDVCLRYQAHNPLALKHITFEIGSSEKVGIVGRTGAGKSSIFAALFRLVELCRGSIFVDEVDVSRLNLKKLRSNLAIVTQDPFLFSGTVRENLDPCGECVDGQVLQAVEKCHLGPVVESLGGLEGKVTEAGRGMSAGERQLFCLARALLCRTKIVCIDEGTSKLDPQTDDHIQQVIRSVFRNKTVIIIAHRMQTVRDCDRVLVMSEGEIVENGRPWELMADKNSHFHAIFKQ